jgi:mRNA interferase MazF
LAFYIPGKGDVVAVTFDPRSGHEQRRRRPALVISNDLFNGRTGLAVVCLITNTDRGVPFHVPVPEETRITGFIMVEQVKSIDYKSRRARKIETMPQETLEEVLSILDACLF